MRRTRPFSVLFDENNARAFVNKILRLCIFLLCAGVLLACGRWSASLLLALRFGPTLALSVGDGLASLGAQFSTGLCMGNNGGSSSGGEVFADRRLAAPREDGAHLAKLRNLFIDGVQDVVVQVRSFSLHRKNNSLASRRLPVVAGSLRLSLRKITGKNRMRFVRDPGIKSKPFPCI